MAKRTHRKPPPLPTRGGLGASRVRLGGEEPVTAWDFIAGVIETQRYRHPEDGAAALAERFAAGEVVLRDGTRLSPGDPVSPGTDVFFYRIPAPETPVPYEIETVFEDADIMVVRKPPFLATMPRAAHITESVTVRMRRATGNEELTPAHRLDRLTTGLLLLTKRREIRGAYQELFARREVEKTYEAIAPDVGLEAPLRWENHLRKDHGVAQATIVPGAEVNAITVVERISPYPLDRPGNFARYVLRPLTGRTHQLRVHMAGVGAPIVGDPLYPVVAAGGQDLGDPLLLAAVGLRFVDPLTGVGRVFTARGW